MRSVGVALVLAAIAGGARAAAPGTEGGKVYAGDDGVEVAIVILKPRSDNQALVRVTGASSELDGKVRLHALRGEPASGAWVGRLHGRDFATVTFRGARYGLSVPERRDELSIHYDEAKTKALDAEAVFAAYQQQTRDGSLAALERFDRAQRIKDAEKELAALAERANRACGGRAQASVAWSGVSDELLGNRSLSSLCGAPLEAMRRLCDAEEARAQLSPIKQVSCTLGAAAKLERAADTLAWTAAEGGANLEQLARDTLLGGGVAAEGAPWGKAETLAQKIALEKTQVCTDGKSHYVVIAPAGDSGLKLFYGDGKRFFSVPREPLLGGSDFLDPRQFNKTANPSFRGLDIRLYSRIEADAQKRRCELHCGERAVPLWLVDAPAARALLVGARYEPPAQQHLPHALLRNERGVYYYVDKGFLPSEARRFRLFKGPKGALKEQKMTNVVADSEGEIFSTKSGSLRLVINRGAGSVWIEGGKSIALREVPVRENLPLIWNDLGVYAGERLGTPCDDL
jgi:hypothetical protein